MAGFAVLVSVAALVADARDANRSDSAEILLSQAGLGKHFDAWPELTLTARDRARRVLQPEVFARLEAVVGELYHADGLRHEVAEHLGRLEEDPRLDSVREFLRSPSGRRVHGAEVYAQSAEALRTQPVFVATLPTNARMQDRFEILKRVDRATHFSRSVLDTSFAIARAFTRGAEAFGCLGGVAAERLERRGRAGVEQRRRAAEMRVWITLGFAYRDLAAGDLAKLLTFVESDRGRWFYDGAYEGLRRALDGADGRLHARLEAERARRCGGS